MRPTRCAVIVAGASFLFLSGCVSTSFRAARDVNTRNLTPVSPATVRFLDAPPPVGSFHTLGEIQTYLTGFPSDETVLRKAREKAASVGADAIVLQATQRTSISDSGLGATSTPSNKVVSITFTAIRILPEGSSQRRP
jgi:hypothetical protein